MYKVKVVDTSGLVDVKSFPSFSESVYYITDITVAYFSDRKLRSVELEVVNDEKI